MPSQPVQYLILLLCLCVMPSFADRKAHSLDTDKPVEQWSSRSRSRESVHHLNAGQIGGEQKKAEPAPTQTDYLAGLGRLWGAIKFFHPYPAYRNLDWDGALIKAIPQVKAARTPGEYTQAINAMLQVLNDPATVAELPRADSVKAASDPPAAKSPVYFRVVDNFVVVSVADMAKTAMDNEDAAAEKQQQMLVEIGKAGGLILDFRYDESSAATIPPYFLDYYLQTALPGFVQGPVVLGTERYRLHSGYMPQRGNTSGGYSSSLVTAIPKVMAGRDQAKKPLAVLINEKTPALFSIFSGLQASGAKILQAGKIDDRSGLNTKFMMLPGGVYVNIRVSEFVGPRGESTLRPDLQISPEAGADDKAVRAAIEMLNSPGSEPAASGRNAAPAPGLLGMKDAPYPQMSFPSEEYRLLALFRFWNVINYFFPYKHLTDQPWDTVLADFIPRFLENKTALDYEMTVAEMVARLQDTHGFVYPLKNLNAHLGEFVPPVHLASAGGRLVVAGWLDEAAAQATGIKLGDTILSIDGEPVERRIAYLARFQSLSTPQSRHAYIYPYALRGGKESKVKLSVEGIDGQTRQIEMARTVPRISFDPQVQRKTPIYQVLPNGYGYIDLARLPRQEAHQAMDAVINTPALIFDMRGYPNGTAWLIAPRLTERKNVTAALFRRPLQSALNFGDQALGGVAPDYSFEQKIPWEQRAIYKGKVVVLINEYAISQAEHTCLFFESATNVTFIGGPTNGANGDITDLVLPGGIDVNFSGHDVRHADGRQLQRVGIQPHIKVEPTAKGIGEGHDEVFEAAIKYLDSTLKN